MSETMVAAPAWQTVKDEIEAEIDRIWLDEPLAIHKIRWGVIDSGAGSGGQFFTVLVHLEAFLMLMGANVMFRFLKVAQFPETTLETMVKMTRTFIVSPFDVFEFLEDLGLAGMTASGKRYSDALDSLETKDDYIALTGAMMTYIIRLHRWVHFIFPWNLGVAFPHRKIAEITEVAALLAAEPGSAQRPVS